MARLSPTIFVSTLAPFLLVGCYPEQRTWFEGHCASLGNGGNAWCLAQHPDENLAYCEFGSPECGETPHGDGCVPTPPADPACYSPCGERQNLAEEPSPVCLGYPHPIGSTTDTSATGASSSTGTTTEGPSTSAETYDNGTDDASETTTDVSGCISDEECIDDASPFCNHTLAECVPCSGMDDPDAACQSADPTAPVCFEEECVPCTDDNSGSCTGDTPACVENECVECTPENTAACDDAHPVCGTANTCVICSGDDLGACGGDTPLCIGETCAPCVAHDECPAGDPSRNAAACDYVTGACFPNDSVWHVDGDAGCSDDAEGSADSPLCTLAAALARAQDSGWGTVVLHERDGGRSYEETLVVPSALRLAILSAEDEAAPLVRGSGQSPGLRVEPGATVYLDRIIIGLGNTNGLEVLGTVYADTIEVSGNRGIGVLVQASGRFEAHRSRIIGNNQGGIRLEASPDDPGDTGDSSDTGIASTGALAGSSGDAANDDRGEGFGLERASAGTPSLYLENSFVAQQVNATDAVFISGGSATILYSSLATQYGGGLARALACEDATISARNSLFVAVGMQNEVVCPGLQVDFSAAEMDLDGTNVSLGQGAFEDEDSVWFENLTAGDLRLNSPPAALLTAARWQPGDPTTDIDGTETRPAGPDNQDVAGADVPGPTEGE